MKIQSGINWETPILAQCSIQKEEEEARHVWINNDSERDRLRQSNQK